MCKYTQMNKIVKISFYMYINVHDRVQRSNAVVYRVVYARLAGNTAFYGHAALSEHGLVSGKNTITWHIIDIYRKIIIS